MLEREFLPPKKDKKTKRQKNASQISNSMLFTGALLVVSSLFYLLFNLDKSDKLIFILLPVFVSGIALLFISQFITPGRSILQHKKTAGRKF